MSRAHRVWLSIVLVTAMMLSCVVDTALAGGLEPVVGAWKGKTQQGLPIYFGVREGALVANVRVTYKDPVCGTGTVRNRTAVMAIDESGHFQGTVYPANGGMEIEGTFTGPRRAKGTLVVGEDTGLPNCLGGTVPFTASPRN